MQCLAALSPLQTLQQVGPPCPAAAQDTQNFASFTQDWGPGCQGRSSRMTCTLGPRVPDHKLPVSGSHVLIPQEAGRIQEEQLMR